MTEELDFRTRTVLQNTDDVWRTTQEVRGALHMNVRQAARILTGLRHRGLVTSRWNRDLRRLEWAITEAGDKIAWVK